MSVARVTEISAQSGRSFDDAVRQGIRRANATLRNVRGAWIKDQQVEVEEGKIAGYRVNMMVTFVLEDAPSGRAAATKPAKAAAAPTRARKPAPKKTARTTRRRR